MKIEVLGPGCMKCNKLYEAAKEAAARAGGDAEVVKVSDLADIVNRGVMVTPALVIDGEIRTAGKVPKVEDILKMLE